MSFLNSFISFGHTIRIVTGGTDSQFNMPDVDETTYWNGFFTAAHAGSNIDAGSIDNTAFGPYTITDIYTTYNDAHFLYDTLIWIYDNGNSVSSSLIHDLKFNSTSYSGIGPANYTNAGGGYHVWAISGPGVNGSGTTTVTIN